MNKIRLTFKTPDVTDYALEEVSEEERDKAEKLIDKYVEYGEYLRVEIDLETGKAEVLEV